MSFFPQTNTKSNGANFPQQNRKSGNFHGKIVAIREITSSKNPTVFGVIELEVEGEAGVFQDYLNFNPDKAESSMGYLVSHCKAAIESSGQKISNPDEEKDMEWVEKSYEKLKKANAILYFNQSVNSQGQLNINFIPETKEDDDEGF